MGNFKPESGFSLVEVMLALGMAGVVGLGAAYVVQSQVVQQKTVESKMDLAAAHAIAMQSARNLKFIGDNMVVQSPATATSPEVRNASLDRCLMSKPKVGENCEPFASIQGQRRKRLPDVMHDAGAGLIVSSLEAERVCGALSCSKITVHVVTQRMNRGPSGVGSGGGNTEAERLTTDVDIPGMSFVPTEQMDQQCAAGSVLTGYDNVTRAAICRPLVDAPDLTCAASTNGPLLGFGTVMQTAGANQVCSNVRARTCPTGGLNGGVTMIGQGSGDIECGSVTTLAPPVVTNPPSNQIACYSRNVGFGGRTGCDNSLQYYATLADCEDGSGSPGLCNRAPFTSRCRAVQTGAADATSCPNPPPTATATPQPGTCSNWVVTNQDPAGCNTPNNNRLYTTLSGVTTSAGYQNLNLAQRSLPTNAHNGDTAAYCGVCTNLACALTEWTCNGTPATVNPNAACYEREVGRGTPPTCDAVTRYFNTLSACESYTGNGGCGALNSACAVSADANCNNPTPVGTPTPATGCYENFEVYFGWTCPGPTDSVSMNCPSGQGAGQRSYGTHSAPAMCNSVPSSSQWVSQECRPCASATPTPSGSCAAGTVNWTAGGNSCSASIASGSNGATSKVKDETGPDTGVGEFTCSAGVWTASSSSTCATNSGRAGMWYFTGRVASAMCMTGDVSHAMGGNGTCPATPAARATYHYSPAGTRDCNGNTVIYCIPCAAGSKPADGICLRNMDAEAGPYD